MIEKVIDSISEIIKQKSIRRSIFVVVMFVASLILLEAYTQYFSSTSLARKVDVVSKVSALGSGNEASGMVEEIQLSLLQEYREIQGRKDSPLFTLFEVFLGFVKGAWPILLLMWILFNKAKFAFVESAKDALQNGQMSKGTLEEKSMQLWLGLQGFSGMAWVATLMGLMSIIWNRSDSFIVSWIFFPFVFLFVLLGLFAWFSLLKTVIPKNKSAA